MALTVEEKLARLKSLPDWDILRPEKKEFLISVANGVDENVAFARAKPDKAKNPRHGASLWSRTLEIKRAFEAMEYKKPESVYTKREAVEDITWRLRKQGLEDETYIKLLSLLAKMNGWDKPKPEKPEEEEEKTPLELVLEAERKRRNGEED